MKCKPARGRELLLLLTTLARKVPMNETAKRAAREQLYGHNRLCEQERTKQVQREDHVVQCFKKGALLPEPMGQTTETMDSFGLKSGNSRGTKNVALHGRRARPATTLYEVGGDQGGNAGTNRGATNIQFGWDKAQNETLTKSDFTAKEVAKKTSFKPEDLYETHLADLSPQYREQGKGDPSMYKTEFDGSKSFREWSRNMAENKMKVGRRQTSTLYQKATHFQLGSEPQCFISETGGSFMSKTAMPPAPAPNDISKKVSQGNSHVFCQGDYNLPLTTPRDHFLSIKQKDYPAHQAVQKGTNQMGAETSDLRALLVDRNMSDFKNQRDPSSINVLQAFLSYDKTRSGSFSMPELRDVCQELGFQISTKQLEDLLKECDINKDGRIDYLEFIKYLTAHTKSYENERHSIPQTVHQIEEKKTEAADILGASYQTATHFSLGNAQHTSPSVYTTEYKSLGPVTPRVHAIKPSPGGVMHQYPVFPTGTSITGQHYSAHKLPSESERLYEGKKNKSNQSGCGAVISGSKSPNEDHQLSVTRSTYTAKHPPELHGVSSDTAMQPPTDFHHLESDRALMHPQTHSRRSEAQESYSSRVSKVEGMEIARKSLNERKSRISDNKQAHFFLGFDYEKKLSENMAEFSLKKPADPNLPAAGKANGPAAGCPVITADPLPGSITVSNGLKDVIQRTAVRNINPRDPANMNLRRAFLEYDKDLSGSISKDELFLVCKAMNIDVNDEKIRDLIKRCDKKGNDEIDYHEFALQLMRRSFKPSNEQMASVTSRDFKHPQHQQLTPIQKLVCEQEAKRHVPLIPVVLHQSYKAPLTTVTKSDFIPPEEAAVL